MTALASAYASQKTAEETRLAIEWYERAIELGEASAFAGLGEIYMTRPDLIDKPKAIRLFKKGAQLGDPNGMRQLGLAHLMGHGVTKDGVVAISWFRKAIKLNNSQAIVNLGRMYASGEGVTRDFNEAFRLMQEAAARDQTDAMNYLADAYSRGVGVPVDRKQALVWVTKAAEMGDPWAKANLPYFQQFQ
ncbi:MAG: sel1 repeat family protein [Gammaproteobacteria bacterium]|nr:sel1 repeat family protein [Gammaproteobacteria bacterium]